MPTVLMGTITSVAQPFCDLIKPTVIILHITSRLLVSRLGLLHQLHMRSSYGLLYVSQHSTRFGGPSQVLPALTALPGLAERRSFYRADS